MSQPQPTQPTRDPSQPTSTGQAEKDMAAAAQGQQQHPQAEQTPGTRAAETAQEPSRRGQAAQMTEDWRQALPGSGRILSSAAAQGSGQGAQLATGRPRSDVRPRHVPDYRGHHVSYEEAVMVAAHAGSWEDLAKQARILDPWIDLGGGHVNPSPAEWWSDQGLLGSLRARGNMNQQ